MNIFNQHHSYANVVDVAEHFPGVGSSFGYVIVDKTKEGTLHFSDEARTDLGFLPKSGYEQCSENLSLDKNMTLSQYGLSQNNERKKRVAIPMTRVITDDNVELLEADDERPKNTDAKENLYFYVYAEDDCKKIAERVRECKDIFNKHCRWSGFLNGKIIEMLKV